ncbi:MAG: hypothetical protein JWN94_1316 [Betaproteobacteria bacterium]|nr:hypothetical protein [Betaproteobacteria bacterium]
MNTRSHRRIFLTPVALLACAILFSRPVVSAEKPVINPPPTQQDWTNLGKLPDFSGVWTHKRSDQNAQMKTNPPSWNEKAAERIKFQYKEEAEGRPPPLFVNCLPEAMPAWMLVTHNAMEILVTPGRVTMLGESDGNRLRRIYTDGRKHPADPDPTFHGHSIGHWEGQTLVVDTVGIHPQTYIAISEAQGVPNNGDMHITERIYLASADELHDELTITAPKVLTKPWKTTRIFFRQRLRRVDIVEGTCLEGYFKPAVDKDGYEIFEPIPHDVGGNRIPPKN